jgi:hypothetical protein
VTAHINESTRPAVDGFCRDSLGVLLNGKLIARGQLVAAGDQFGVQVTEIIAMESE